MEDLVRIEGFVIDLGAVVEAEKTSDGRLVLSYTGGHTATFRADQADVLWEVLQRRSRTPQAFMAGVAVGMWS